MAATFEESLMENMTRKRERLLAQLHTDAQVLDPVPSAGALRAARRIVSTINLDTGRHLNENAVIGIAKIIDRETSTGAQEPADPAPTEEEMSRMAQLVDVPYELAQHTPRCTQEYADSCLSREEWIERLNDEFERC